MEGQAHGRAWATLGFGVGIAASIAANIAHSYTLPHPHFGAIVSAAFWPVGLLISIEIISRVEWPRAWSWAALRYGGLSTVAAIAAVVSYRHMSGLLRWYGEDWLTVAIGPLAIDGLMVVSSAALMVTGARLHSAPIKVVVAEPRASMPVRDLPPEREPQPGKLNGTPVALDMPPKRKPGQRGAASNTEDRKEAARQTYRESVESGTPLTGKQLGERHGMGERWGRARVQEAQAALVPA